MNIAATKETDVTMNTASYISMDNFANICGRKVSTIQKRYKDIPGIVKDGSRYMVLQGTRYPFSYKRYKLDSSSDRRYVLLKAISKYEYISYKELKLSPSQFEKMLLDFEQAGLVQKNDHDNRFGANGYDCTAKGDDLLAQIEKKGWREKAEFAAKIFAEILGEAIVKMITKE